MAEIDLKELKQQIQKPAEFEGINLLENAVSALRNAGWKKTRIRQELEAILEPYED